MTRAGAIAYWIVPSLVTVILYWPGLTAWFQKDDLIWLGLHQSVHSWRDLLWALFTPFAQGTIRTLSERIFFLSFFSIFEMDALPYRCLAFSTHIANLLLIAVVCGKITCSRAAGFWAAVIYTVNSSLAVPLSWTAIYYEILCSFCFLLNLWLLIRYAESGLRRYYIYHWICFVLGFGVLELNVVYPAIAAAYALCFAPRLLRKVLPMFLCSAAYTIVHFLVAPGQSSGPYKMFWDLSVFKTLWTYWLMALGPARLSIIGIFPSFWRSAATVLLIVGLIGFLLCKIRRRQWAVVFFAAWFLIVLAPLLPLRNHISEYYLTVPLVGLAMWGGWAVAEGLRAGIALRVFAGAMLTIYLSVSVLLSLAITRSFHERSLRIESLVMGVMKHHRRHMDKAIVLRNVDAEMFRSAIYFAPFRIFGVVETYLVPGPNAELLSGREYEATKDIFLDDAKMRALLVEHRAIVYDVRGENVVEVTSQYP